MVGIETTTLNTRPQTDLTGEIRRFRRSYRRRVRNVALLHRSLADLVISFPAAAFALATEFGDRHAREAAIDLVKDGQPLRRVAKALGLPLWFRKLPPEAFREPFGVLPMSVAFQQGVSGHIPREAAQTADWLATVLGAWRACDEEFAVWIARKRIYSQLGGSGDEIVPLAAFAWFSARPQSVAGGMIARQWCPRMTFESAVTQAQLWWDEVKLELFIGGGGISDAWLSEGRAAGYRFVPLLTQHDLATEADAMSNCVRDYAEALAQGRCRLFGVRRAGRHVATLEVHPHPHHPGIPELVQLCGPNNEDAPTRVWKAAFVWLGKQAEFNVPQRPGDVRPTPDVSLWQQLWRPYLQEKGAHVMLPAVPCQDTVVAFERHLAALSQRP